eukprot:scaffold138_cov145-Chaetoceros_neogracile.AAC.2
MPIFNQTTRSSRSPMGLALLVSNRSFSSAMTSYYYMQARRKQQANAEHDETDEQINNPGAGQCRVVAGANVDDEVYAIQAAGCPRCAFDLYEGDIVNDDSFEDLPPRTIACPTCATRKCLLLTTYRWKKVSYVTSNVKCLPSIPLELLLLRCPFEIKSLITSIFAYSTCYTKKRKRQLEEAKHLSYRSQAY